MPTVLIRRNSARPSGPLAYRSRWPEASERAVDQAAVSGLDLDDRQCSNCVPSGKPVIGRAVHGFSGAARHGSRMRRSRSDDEDPGLPEDRPWTGTDSTADIEAIKQLKARYFRTLDTKDWTAFRAIFTDDLVLDTSGSGGDVINGADAFLEFLQPTLADVVTVHHGHMPEIELTSPTIATGIWAMEDLLRWPDGTELRGYGHYHETYEKSADRWRIKSSSLTRLRMDFTEAPKA